MLDRASTFADDEVIALLQQRFIPVTANASHRDWSPDEESEFYRSVVYQREGIHKGVTSQGFYIFSPDGKLISGWNNRDTDKVKRLLKAALAEYQPPKYIEPITGKRNRNFTRVLPDGGLVVDVFSKIINAHWPPTLDKWDAAASVMFRASTGRDHLWITKEEIASLTRGTMPESVTRRIALYHLIDNTRGEPPMWKDAELRSAKITLTPVTARDEHGKTAVSDRGYKLIGDAEAATSNGDRAYIVKLVGYVEAKGDKLTRFDLVARGQFRGHGQYTGNNAPLGPFTMAIAFAIADQTTEAAKIPPQGFNEDEYLKP